MTIDLPSLGTLGRRTTLPTEGKMGSHPAGAHAEPPDIEHMVPESRRGEQTTKAVVVGNSRQLRSDTRPASTFLAQHISQELMPKAPALDEYAQVVQAYTEARDINLDLLSPGRGLRIKV